MPDMPDLPTRSVLDLERPPSIDGSRRRILLAGAAMVLGVGCGSDPPPAASAAKPDPTGSTGKSRWARGGTATIAASYPDPFASGLSGACTLTCVRTVGPCYAKTIDRRDISEGRPGLPMRLDFLVVDDACKPVEGAIVDIWHASSAGLYSADDTERMCNGGDADAMAHRFFRGMQRSDGRGRVTFDTCFPGWYRGRAVHIHFTVRRNDKEYVTSQLFFETSLLTEIYSQHPDYAHRGQPDTPTERDNIAGADPRALTLDVGHMSDGVMLASKSIVLRSQLTDAICGDTGGGGPGGGGGPPPGPPPGKRSPVR